MKTRKTPQPDSRLWWPPLLIIGAACVFCWPVFLGRIMLPADMCLLMLPWKALQNEFPHFSRVYNPMLDPIQQYLPWRIYAVDSIRAGVIPLWNPYSFCGTPFLANLQSTLLYPLNLVFLLAGARHGFGVSAIVHLSLGGLFMYAFLRTLKMRQAAATFGALVFMFNGFTVSWLEYPTLSLWVLMWLPALLLCYEQALRTRSRYWALLCPLVLGLQFVGGHFQVSAYMVIAFLLYALVRAVTPGLRARARLRGVVLAVISLGCGLLLAAAQILPTLELAAQTGRVSHGLAGALRTAFPLGHLVLYLVPNFFGNPVHYNYWGSYRDPGTLNFFETACYVGILPLLFGVWSLRRWREPGFRFFSLLTAFAVLVAVGSPIYVVLYHLAPGLRELAGLGRILCLAAFGLAGLAALGLDDLLSLARPSRVPAQCHPERSEGSRLRTTISVLLFSVLVAAFVLASYAALRPVMIAFSPEFPGYFTGQLLAFAVLLVTGAILIVGRARLRLSVSAFSCLALVLLIADLFGFGIRFNPYADARMAYPETETTRWLQQHAGHDRLTSLASDGMDWMAHNSAMVFGLRDIHGSDSLRVRRSFELVSPPDGNQSRYPTSESRLLDALGMRYLITDQAVGGRWRLVHDSEAPVYENPYAAPRAYCAQRLQAADEATTREMMSRGGRPALVSPDVERQLRGKVEPAVVAIEQPCQFLRDDPDHQVIETHAASGALLVVTDSCYPGWRAWVDERPARIYRVNYGFRGIAVPAGEHRVEMRYEPASYRCGLFLSLLALSVVTGLASASRLASRASASTTAGRR